MTREDDLINEKIEGYHIAAGLISNSFRSIFLGESISSTDPHQLVVIELFYSAPAHTQQEQQDILNKISVLRKVDHSHILPILAAGFHKEIPYIITEYLPAGSLYDRFQYGAAGQPIPIKDAILTLAQVGQALYYAHQRQVVHGSLRPQNVLFTEQNEALVTGFYHHALLRSDDENAREEISIYQAPEQLPGQASEKGDQYALACLAYALFTGSQAFTVPSVNTPGTYYKTKSLISPGRMNLGLPLYIENAILKAMSRDPDQRYPDIAAFLAALGIPSTGRKNELKETVALLAQIMQEGSAETPTIPGLEVDTLETAKILEVAATRDGKRTTSDTFSLLPPDRAMPFNAKLSNIPDATDTHEKEQSSSRFQLAYGGLGTPSFRNIKKNFTARPRRTSAVMLGLIAIMIICITILVDLNFSPPSKEVATLPPMHKTSAASSSTQVSTTMTTLRTPSSTIGITIPSRKATPQQRTVPTTVPTTAPTPSPTSAPTVAPTSAPAQVLVTLNSFFNNEGLGNAPRQADFDGNGYSYPASQFPSARQINVQGVPYQFPYTGSGTNDNVVASGQAILLTPGKYRQAFVLASASWGPVSGTIIIKYTDGSTSQGFVTVSDWYSNSGPLNAPYRYTPNRIDNNPVCIYAIPISLNATRVADALILPYQVSGPHQNGRLHIFALTLLS